VCNELGFHAKRLLALPYAHYCAFGLTVQVTSDMGVKKSDV